MLKDGLHGLLLRLMQPRLLRWRQALAIIVVVQVIGAALVLLRLDLNNAPELYFPHDAPATVLERELRAEFPNADGRLLPGQFVRARLLAGDREGVFLVPQSAVIQTEQARLVMVATAENKVAPRPVQAGEWRGRDWVILGGLKAGDKVIVGENTTPGGKPSSVGMRLF